MDVHEKPISEELWLELDNYEEEEEEEEEVLDNDNDNDDCEVYYDYLDYYRSSYDPFEPEPSWFDGYPDELIPLAAFLDI